MGRFLTWMGMGSRTWCLVGIGRVAMYGGGGIRGRRMTRRCRGSGIRSSGAGAHQHHDQVFGDFMGTGRPQLVYWNQRAKKLLIAEIPARPREVEEWPAREVFTEAGSRDELGKYAEGVFAEDVDGDGRVDLLAGNYWFKYLGEGQFKPVKVGTIGGRIVAGHLIKDSKVAKVVIAPGDGVGPLKWYECRGIRRRAADWVGHDLLGGTWCTGTRWRWRISMGTGISTSSRRRWRSGRRRSRSRTIRRRRR